MADGAALDPGGAVLVEKRSALVRVALQAGFLLESAEPFSRRRLMGVMAGGAAEDSFLQPMTLVQIELGEDVLMAGKARFRRADLQQVRVRLGRMHGVTGRAIQGGLAVGTGHKPGTALGVAFQACFGLLRGEVCRLEGEDIRSAAFLDMLFRSGMARRAAGLSDRCVGLIEKALDNVFMTASACVGVLGGLDNGFCGRKKSSHAQGQS